MPANTETAATPFDECITVTRSIKAKADKYKIWARLSVLGVTAFSAAIPVFIGLGDTWITEKLIPSVLAALSALIAAWVQLERPHERWKLYRRYHRTLEAEQVNYRFKAGVYKDEGDPDRLLALRLGEIQLRLHDEWEGLIPGPTDISDQTRVRLG